VLDFVRIALGMGGDSDYSNAEHKQSGQVKLLQTHRFSPVGTVDDRNHSADELNRSYAKAL